jgi:hypothetical protein
MDDFDRFLTVSTSMRLVPISLWADCEQVPDQKTKQEDGPPATETYWCNVRISFFVFRFLHLTLPSII